MAVALLLPAVVTTLASAISPSGTGIIRDVNPLPAALVKVATISAPKISSFATVVVVEREIEMYRRYATWYGYVFYLMQVH